MDLKEISATAHSPYRCYVRGEVVQSEGENVFTVGFKDGLAVVQALSGEMEARRRQQRDNAPDSKAIDLTKLKKIIVKVDPQTGKKYIVRDGRRIEILPQVQSLTVKTEAAQEAAKRNIVIKGGPQSITALGKIFNGAALYSKLAPKQKVADSVKYQVVALNLKKEGARSAATMTEAAATASKALQTDGPSRRDEGTQTELCSGRESPFTDTFFSFILGENEHECGPERRLAERGRLRTKEDISKFNFFNDVRIAMNFDRSGNLPIHASVMQDDLRAVQKCCIVLKAIRENVNIVNQQGYAPLHLAILHDVSVDIVKTLVDHGADLGVADTEGNTAIHLAIESKRSDVLKVLVPWACQSNFNLDIFNYEGFTPLILACLNHSFHDAKLLLDHGADPNVKDMKSGRTALFHAAEGFDVDLVELLMDYKADTKIRNFFGTSPHDAMFEVEDMPIRIKFCILGRDHQRSQSRKKLDIKNEGGEAGSVKRAKLQTTPVLKRVSASDFHSVKLKRK